MGDLSPLGGSPRRVVALFNKGGSAEQLSAPVSLYARYLAAGVTATVRDVVARKDVNLGTDGAIEVTVPRHGVALFVVTFGS